jgi:uncharacterized repeat protein (TIGR01451 family)
MSGVIRKAGSRAVLGATLSALLVWVSIGLADPSSPITVSNVDSPDPVASGTQLQYSITVVNTAGSKLSNVVLSDQVNGVGGIGVPPKLVTTSTRGICTQNVNNLVTCSAGTIEGGGSWTVTIRGIVTAANGTTLNNTASITGTRSAQNFTTTATATTLVTNNGGTTLPDLTIAKTGPTTVNVNNAMAYVLTINNQGTANATGVTVIDTLPPGVAFVSTNPTSLFTCTPAVPTPSPVTVVCIGGAVNQGANATITINGTSPAAPTTITNTASVDPDNAIQESNELNNASALVNTAVINGQPPPTYGFSIDKTDDGLSAPWAVGAGPDPVQPGQNVTYKILVKNISPSGTTNRADDVVVVDGTQGLEAASIQVNQVITNGVVGNGNGCVVNAPQVRCSIRSLDPGGTMLVTVTGQVVGSAGSSLFNTATVTGNVKNVGRTATDSETTTVRPGVDLTITKAGSPNPVCARSWPTNTAASYPPPAAPVGMPPTPPLLGPAVCLGGLTYDFVIGNSGLDLASGVVLRDPLPPGTVFHQFDDLDGAGFTCGPPDAATNVLQCTGGAIPHASTKRVRIVLIAPPTIGTITNTVTVDPANAIFEGDETNNTASYVTQVATGIDLAIAKYDTVDTTLDVPPTPLEGFEPIATNGTQTYTIEIDNLGPQDVTGIRIRDTLPAGTIFRSAQEFGPTSHGFTCSHAAGVVDCQGGALKGTASEFYFSAPPANDRAVIKIRLFAQGIVGTMHNEVRVDPFNQIPEINELNNIAVQDTEVTTGGAGMGAFNELTIDKRQTDPDPDDPDHTSRNAVVTYVIEIKNNGTDPVTDIVVRDFLPAGARYIEATGDPASQFNCSQQQGHIECVGGRLPAAAGTPPVPVGSAIITLKMFAPDTPGTYTNQAIVDPDHLIPEGNEFNNQDSVQTIVVNGGEGDFNNLKIHKTSAPEPPASTPPGGPITYTLQVWNDGEAPALNVSVRDELPAGVTFVSAADFGTGGGAPFTCNHAAGVVNCIGATILENTAIGTGRSITIKVTAPNEITTLENEAIVDPNNAIPEGDEFDNTAFAQTSVQSVINLKITKTGPPTSSQSKQEKYTIKVKNEKGSNPTGQTAFNVQVHDPLPVGLIPLAAEIDPGDQNNWACQILQNPINVVDCEGDLNPDQEVTIVIEVFMTAESGKSLDNEACVDPLDLIKEFSPPGETDNCSTHTTAVVPLTPNLSLTKTSEPASVTPGADLTYTVLIHNIGTAAAPTPITITDTLPTGQVDFVGASGTNGWTCSFSSPTVTCSDPGTGLGVGEAQTMTIQVKVKTGVTQPFTNTAEVPAAPGELDGHKGDNKATVTTQVSGSGRDLILTSVTDTPDPVTPSQMLTYTVIAVNAGTDDADDADIRIDFPSGGVAFQSAEGTNGFNCTQPGALDTFFTCTGDLPGGGDTTITVKLAVKATLMPPTDLTLSATIDPVSGGDPDGEFTETNEGNNTNSETTTVSGVACVSCIDLVATEMVANPAITGSSTTFTAQIINVGDQATNLNGTTDNLFRLWVIATSGSFTPGTLTLSQGDPATMCTTTTIIANVSIQITCRGNLGPAQGLTLTYGVSGVTGDLYAEILADPSDLIDAASTPPEFREDNNLLYTTVVHFF